MSTATTLQERAISDSRAWFPATVVDGGHRGALVHYALGISGEVGELEEKMASGTPREVADELADVAIYFLDITAELGINVSDFDTVVELNPRHPLIVPVGLVVNAIKKYNRNPGTEEFNHVRDVVNDERTTIWSTLMWIARLYGTTIERAIDNKRQVLIRRWGEPK